MTQETQEIVNSVVVNNKKVSPVKAFILDTCVCVQDPDCLNNFGDNVVVILELTLNEIDKFKKEFSERGASSREFIRKLNEIESFENLIFNNPLKSYSKNKLMFITNKMILEEMIPYSVRSSDNSCRDKKHIPYTSEMDDLFYEDANFDNIVFNSHFFIKKVIEKASIDRNLDIQDIILVTNDKILYSKINLMTEDFEAQFYEHNQVNVEEVYDTNFSTFSVPVDLNALFFNSINDITMKNRGTKQNEPYFNKYLIFPEVNLREELLKEDNSDRNLLAKLLVEFIKENSIKVNEHFEIELYFNDRRFAYLAYRFIPQIVSGKTSDSDYAVEDSAIKIYLDSIMPMEIKSKFYGVSPRNLEQAAAVSLMYNKDVKLICLSGVAGTGKTLMAFSSALDIVTNQNNKFPQKKVVLVRPIKELGEEMGHLPGTVKEKMAPHLGAFADCVDVVHANGDKRTKGEAGLEELIQFGVVEIQPIAFVRGRTISNAIIIIDEAQNCSYGVLKALITRAGENTKIILCGDPDQCDSLLMTKSNSGLSQIIDKMNGQILFAHVNLVKGERSDLAAVAARIL